MSKTIRSTDRDAAQRKADKRRKALVRAQKRSGQYFPPSQGELIDPDVWAATDGYRHR